MNDSRLYDVLLSLDEARFDVVVARVAARPWVTAQAPPVVRARELHDWARESALQEHRLRDELAVELAAWPTDVRARWRAWATLRLGEIPILGFQGTMRAPVDLRQAFVPLALSVRHGVMDERLGGDTERWVGWSLHRAISDAEETGTSSVRGIALVGLPGSGKTTLLKHAWGVVADRGAPALGFRQGGLDPVFVRVAWCDPDHAPHEVLPRALRHGLGEHGYGGAVDVLLGGPLVWMLDGLDEAGSLDRRKALAERLGQAMDHRPGDRYLLTSRTAGWRDVEGLLRGRLRAWDVQALDREQIGPFILRWHEAVLPVLVGTGRTREELSAEAARSAEDLSGRLLSSDWLTDGRRERMARNPLLLSVLCLVNRKFGRLPEKRAELYEHALWTMFEELRRIDAFGPARERSRGLPYKEGMRVLAAIAWQAHDGGDGDVREFTTAEAAGWMRPVLERMVWPEPEPPDAHDLLRRAEEDCGVLQATAAGRWQFAHLTFQEYLAALHAAAEEQGGSWLAARAGQDRWEEPIRLAMSTERLPVELLRAILGDPAAPWERERFRVLMADCAREADPTPFAEALRRCHGVLAAHRCTWVPEAWMAWLGGGMTPTAADTLAGRVLALFQGRVLPLALTGPAEALAGLPMDGPARRQARALLGLAVTDQPRPVGSDGPAPGDVRVVLLPGGLPLSLVWVPGGTFWMGASAKPGSRNHDPEAHADEGPVRQVCLTSGAWLGMHPVTNAQYRVFARTSGHRAPDSFGRGGFDADEQPVTGVDWSDAGAFCRWVGSTLGERVELPTEALWERAARGDDARRYPWGDEPPTSERAVFGGAPLAAVGGRAEGAGPFGTHDQAGNVWEWCRDVWVPRYPVVSGVEVDPCHEPTLPGAAPRVVRGGSWDSGPGGLRAADRSRGRPGDRFDGLGFRVCVLREPGR